MNECKHRVLRLDNARGEMVCTVCGKAPSRTAEDERRLNEMFLLRQPPMSNTDREFMEGRCNGNQFEGQPHVGDHYRRIAEAAGVDITGAYYMGGLASYPGDPTAWVRGRGDVERVCLAKGMDCDGSVKVKGYDPKGPPEAIDIADDLVESELRDTIASHPEPQKVDRGELKEKIRNKRKPPWAKK